jgi:rubrerythrin
MRKFVCSICGYVHDEARGTRWEQLLGDWVCPLCGATKAEFYEEAGAQAAAPAAAPAPAAAVAHGDMREMTALEVSAVCSNLARGCEKQYKPRESALFSELAAHFKAPAAPAEAPDASQLAARVAENLSAGFPAANAASSAARDRGALRALVWSEKVTRILKSLLDRWAREGERMIENTGVFVCTICGFVYVGDGPPSLCPVCKVPDWKFEKVEGR